MRTVKMQISAGSAEKLIADLSGEAGLEVYPGVLTDNYTIDFEEPKRYKFGRTLCRRYLIAREIYLNEWSSGVELILTDSERVFNGYIKEFNESS